MPIIHIPAPTEAEIKKYKEWKESERLKALSDKEKQTPKKVLAITTLRNVTAGICPNPKCGHCLILGDAKCDECFQTVKWFD